MHEIRFEDFLFSPLKGLDTILLRARATTNDGDHLSTKRIIINNDRERHATETEVRLLLQ